MFQLAPYRLDLPRFGDAVIINNVATEFPGSMVDVEALRDVFHQMGLDVQVHKDCLRTVSVSSFCLFSEFSRILAINQIRTYLAIL